MDTVRWNVIVSSEVDQSLRVFLANHGGRKGDLSRFIEEAVKARIFQQTVDEIKSANKDLPETDINALIDEALDWARS
jgi:hypothetical protein